MADPMRDARVRALDALDHVIQRERAWLDLTVLRFVSHPGLPAVFPEYLVGVYHSMRTAGALMEAARLRSIALAPDCPVAERLVDYWTRHIVEEAGHDQWMLADIEGLGIDVERALAPPPLPEVAELMGTLHFWILHAHPVAALAYFYIVEGSPPTVRFLDALAAAAAVPRESLQTFYRHSAIDVAHGRELEALIDGLPLTTAHRELLAVSATTVIRQITRIVERHVARADELRA